MTLKTKYKRIEISEILKALENSNDVDNIILSKVKFTTSLIQLEGKISALGLQIPYDYNEFLKFTNGAHLYGVTIYGAHAVTNYYKIGKHKYNGTKKYSNLWCIGSDSHSNNILMELDKSESETNALRNKILKENNCSLETIAKSFTEFLYSLLYNKDSGQYP